MVFPRVPAVRTKNIFGVSVILAFAYVLFVVLHRVFPNESTAHTKRTVIANDLNLRHANATIPVRLCAPVPPKFPVDSPMFPCAWLSSLSSNCTHRLRARLQCGSKPVRMVYEWVSVDTPPATYRFEDECLMQATKDLCYEKGEDLIPNLSHFVMFGGYKIRNYTFLAVLSSVRFLQPCMVMIHADDLPVGPFWDTLVRLIPHLMYVKRSRPQVIFGNKVKVIEHQSDIARLEAILKFGGVYQDTDYLMVNPFEDLRNNSVVMSTTIPNTNYANGIFMGKPQAPFLSVWYDNYRSFDDTVWGFHSTILPYILHQQRPDLDFHEVHTFMDPYFANIKERFYDNFLDWKRLHGLHLYVRFFPQYLRERFDQGNSSLGQVTRHILFGDSLACFDNKGLGHDLVRMKLNLPKPLLRGLSLLKWQGEQADMGRLSKTRLTP